ncbi:YlmH family RNA-binding protein [Sutcliffiella cohnii]
MTIYQHFRQEEHEFIDHVLEWKETVEEQYAPKLTDFLDPREQEIVRIVVGENQEVKVGFHGGNDGTERKRALLYPSYFNPTYADYDIKAFELSYASKFITLEHPQILGSLMSLGLKRSKFGDIIFEEERIQIVVAEEISSFVELQLKEIGKASVSMRSIPLENISSVKENWEEFTTTITSTRLDVIVASIYNMARQKAKLLVEGSKVKVNWRLVEQPSFDCQEGDVISVRGFGRCKLISFEGKTKKDKWRLLYGKQK